jgi:hypothetical protein
MNWNKKKSGPPIRAAPNRAKNQTQFQQQWFRKQGGQSVQKKSGCQK